VLGVGCWVVVCTRNFYQNIKLDTNVIKTTHLNVKLETSNFARGAAELSEAKTDTSPEALTELSEAKLQT
jgi:hypothetical protein